MIRLTRTMGHCAVCSSGASTWPVAVAAPVLVVRITVASGSGSGATVDLCEYHARTAVHSPDYGDDRCACCGHRGAVQQLGPSTYGSRTRYAVSVCRQRCAAALIQQIGVALAMSDGEATEWDDSYVPPSWMSASERIRDAMDMARRGSRR